MTTKQVDKFTCPKCGKQSEQLCVCPRCEEEGCVERCNAGGVGCICAACEDREMLEEENEA